MVERASLVGATVAVHTLQSRDVRPNEKSPQTTGTKITVEQTDLGRREGYSRCVWAAVLRTTSLCTIVTSFLEQVEIVLQH